MDHGQLSMVADKFQWVFSESLLNACGQDTKFCRRERIIGFFAPRLRKVYSRSEGVLDAITLLIRFSSTCSK